METVKFCGPALQITVVLIIFKQPIVAFTHQDFAFWGVDQLHWVLFSLPAVKRSRPGLLESGVQGH